MKILFCLYLYLVGVAVIFQVFFRATDRMWIAKVRQVTSRRGPLLGPSVQRGPLLGPSVQRGPLLGPSVQHVLPRHAIQSSKVCLSVTSIKSKCSN